MNISDWISQAVKLCIDIYSNDLDYNKGEFNKLNAIYNDFNSDEIDKLEEMLFSEFKNDDLIFIFSIFTYYMNNDAFKEYLYKCVIKKDTELFIKDTSLEFQLYVKFSEHYREKRLLHQKSVKKVIEYYGYKEYIPFGKRNKSKLVIVTDQVLSLLHAPTKIVLEFCYNIQKYLNYEIILIACPTGYHLEIEEYYFVGRSKLNVHNGFPDNQWFRLEYRDEFITMKQICPDGIELLDMYGDMINEIYEYNPFFVLGLGYINPVFDYINTFTTFVAKTMSIMCPVSEADYLIRDGKREEEYEKEYREMTLRQKQIFIKSKCPAMFENGIKGITRNSLGIPEEAFVLCIVGNRLDREVDSEFIAILKKIINISGNIHLALIGDCIVLQKKLSSDIFKNRVHFLGYRDNLFEIYGLLDCYINPNRLGGGWSAGIAISAGIPVITLENCDVAYNISNRFHVKNYDEMIIRVSKYANDKDFYKKEIEYISENCKKDASEEMKQYVNETVDSILVNLDY